MLGRTQSPELAMAINDIALNDCHVTPVTIIEPYIHIPYYHKSTEQQFGAA